MNMGKKMLGSTMGKLENMEDVKEKLDDTANDFSQEKEDMENKI